MAEWVEISSNWLVRREQLPENIHLICWKRPDGKPFDVVFPYGWVRVFDRSFENNLHNPAPIEEFRLEAHLGLLELECIAHAMREKYKLPLEVTTT